jgi:protein ImuB
MWPIDLLRRRERRGMVNFHPSRQRVSRHEVKNVVGRQTPTAPLLLFAPGHGVQVVAHCCEQAKAAGVQHGMIIAHARALLDRECRVEPSTSERQAHSLHRLAQWASRYSPLVAPDPPDGLLIDITGCQRVFGGEERLLQIVINDMNRLGFHARAACASTIGCAWAMARFSGDLSCVDAGAERQALAPLPVAALRIDQPIIDALHEVEITLIGHLIDLPRSQLASRFGAQLLLRLDQALGRAGVMETIQPVRPQPPPTVERLFDGPTTQLEGIHIAVQELLEELAGALQRQERGIRRVDLHMLRVDATPIHIAISLSRPNRNPRHLWSLLRPHVDQANVGFGVERITLIATRMGTLAHEQVRLDNQRAGPSVFAGTSEGLSSHAGELIDAIAARFGPDHILRAVPNESHLPEAAFEFHSAMRQLSRHALRAAIASAQRPTVLLPQPALIEMELANHQPARILIQNIHHSIITCIGPERIALAWWRSSNVHPLLAPLQRDYYAIHTDAGRCFWVYRDGQTGQWFLHGWWA